MPVNSHIARSGQEQVVQMIITNTMSWNLEEEEIKTDWIIKEDFMEEMKSELYTG